jgi:Fe2+ transport system protein FeoA
MKLKDFNIGAKLRVTGFTQSSKPYRQKLLSMGLTRGKDFVIVRKAPLGDPLEIKLGASNILLRGDEADAVDVVEVRP